MPGTNAQRRIEFVSGCQTDGLRAAQLAGHGFRKLASGGFDFSLGRWNGETSGNGDGQQGRQGSVW